MRKVKRNRDYDPCYKGCNIDKLLINTSEIFGRMYPAICQTCKRIYSFSIIQEEYPDGYVLIYVAEAVKPSKRNPDYDIDYTIIYREKELPTGNDRPKLQIADFLSGYDAKR